MLSKCSTAITAVGNSTALVAHCDEQGDELSYSSRDPKATDMTVSDWVAVGSSAMVSLGLNNGAIGEAGANMAVLTELMRPNSTLDSKQPSLAELLGALFMPSLLLSAQDSPFKIQSVGSTTNHRVIR